MSGPYVRNQPLHVVVLAAGKGSRMCSSLPKVLHTLAGQELYQWALNAVSPLSPDSRTMVISPDWSQDHIAAVPTDIQVVTQDERKGTGHALMVCREVLADKAGWLLMIYGDTPLVRSETLNRMIETAEEQQADLAVTGFHPDNPGHYGRLITATDGTLERIVEFKDADDTEREVRFCNGGLMLMRLPDVLRWLEHLDNNNEAGEYYATDLVSVVRSLGGRAIAIDVEEQDVKGVNTRVELTEAETIIQQRLCHRAIMAGVTMLDPSTVYLYHDTVLQPDVVLEPHQMFGAGVVVETGARLKAYGHYEQCRIGAGCMVGPFARLRPGTVMDEGAKVGNFVEVKNARLGRGAKVNHLSYVGDARVGERANIGAGTVTCNYDGFHKHTTDIGDGAFIGSNTALVAPVSIGDGAIVGAGSTITADVKTDALSLTRAPQIEKVGWAQRFHRAMKARQ